MLVLRGVSLFLPDLRVTLPPLRVLVPAGLSVCTVLPVRESLFELQFSLSDLLVLLFLPLLPVGVPLLYLLPELLPRRLLLRHFDFCLQTLFE
jgi:hypothetical protein